MKPSRNITVLISTAILAGILSCPAASQEAISSYPSRPITIVFNNTGPTSSDAELRLYQNILKNTANLAMTFEYRGGASGAIGAAYVARHRPDGYTYLGSNSTIVSLPLLNKDAGYDINRDFEPVTLMSKKNFMLLTRFDAPFRTVKEYVDYARANPTKLNWSTSGEGSSTHIPGLMLQSAVGADVTFIHYKVANERLTDLMAGRVDITVGTVLASMGMVKTGKMRAIAVTSASRSPLQPDLPTIAESGLPGLADYEYASWLALFAPLKTPVSLTGKFTDLLRQAGKDPALMKALYESDTVQVVSTAEQFRQFLSKENGRLSTAFKAAGLMSK